MYQINAHTIPTPECSQYGKVKGAFAVMYVDFKDIDGAFELTKFSIQNEGWEIEELEDEYFILNTPEDVKEEHLQYYHEALELGFSLVFFCYESEEEEND